MIFTSFFIKHIKEIGNENVSVAKTLRKKQLFCLSQDVKEIQLRKNLVMMDHVTQLKAVKMTLQNSVSLVSFYKIFSMKYLSTKTIMFLRTLV